MTRQSFLAAIDHVDLVSVHVHFHKIYPRRLLFGNPIVQTENLGAFERIIPSQVHRVQFRPGFGLQRPTGGNGLRFSLVVPANQEGLDRFDSLGETAIQGKIRCCFSKA